MARSTLSASWRSCPASPGGCRSSRPACSSSISAETFSAPESCLSTRTVGWCIPRSSSLRYGLDRLVSSAICRSVRLASLRWLRMKAPNASICVSHWLVMISSSWLAGPVSQAPGSWRRRRERHQRSQAFGGAVHRHLSAKAQRSQAFGAEVAIRALLLVSLGVAGGQQRSCRLEHVFGELALAGQQFLGEVVRIPHQLLGLGQLVGDVQAVGERELRELGSHRLDGAGPALDRVDDRRLALADGVQDLTGDVLPDV